MLQKFAIFCLLAASACGLYTPNIKVRFGFFPYDDHFVKMPRNIDEAIEHKWVKKDRPTGPAGLESLELWCPEKDYSFCVLLDDTGYTAGVQVGVADSRMKFTYNPIATGLTPWTTTLNGTSVLYHTIQVYFIAADVLKTSKESRLATRKADRMLQYDHIWMTGYNGKLFPLPLDSSLLGTASSDFTKQACLPWMGQHFYHKMSESTACSAESLFPWFPLVSSNEVIGFGFMVLGKYQVDTSIADYFEHPGRTAVQAIVNHGPQCLYDLADEGVLTMHVYVMDSPRTILCPLW